MAFNFSYSYNFDNDTNLPKINQRLPKIKVKTDIPQLDLSDETLFLFDINQD